MRAPCLLFIMLDQEPLSGLLWKRKSVGALCQGGEESAVLLALRPGNGGASCSTTAVSYYEPTRRGKHKEQGAGI